MKVIFLDIDGVLNISEGKNATFRNKMEHMEVHLISRLNFLLDSIEELKIVISSTWRKDMDDLKYNLEYSGFKHWNRVIGKTIKEDIFQFRSDEINDYLMNSQKKIKNFICIDDQNIFKENDKNDHLKDKVLKIDPNIGLSQENINYLMDYFKK